jgi:DNA-binding PadR family transcriptional regulator
VTTYQLDGWTALGDRTRRAIFERQHLKVLKDAGLVVDQHAGNRRIYRVNPDGLAELRADVDRFWNTALAAYKAAVEQQAEEVA